MSALSWLSSLVRTLGTRVDQMGDQLTKLGPIWSTNLVKNPIWSTHLVNQQYPPIWSTNLVKSNLVIIDHIGSQICQSGQSNLVNSPIWSSQFGHQTNLVNLTMSTKSIWSNYLTRLEMKHYPFGQLFINDFKSGHRISVPSQES